MQSMKEDEFMARKSEPEPIVRPRIRFSHEDSALAQFLTRQIDAVSAKKNQREIASEIGLDKPNVISMYKRGETKVPLARVPALAKALGVDPMHLFRLAIDQSYPEIAVVIKQIAGNVVTDNEMQLVKKYRAMTKDTDPTPSTQLISAMKEVVGKK